MKIKTFKKIKGNKYSVLLDNDEEINLYDDVIVKYNLLVNKELDDNKLKEITKYNSKMDAYYLSIKSLNKKMRTRKELYKLLKKNDIEDSVINEVINKLYEDNYLNDQRYINAYINDQVNLGSIGPNKIRNDLLELGFNANEINVYLENIDDSVWEDKINKYITKKLKSSNNLSAKKLKQKLAIDLVTKGFCKDSVLSLIDNYEFKTDEGLLIKEYNKIKKKLEIKYSGSELNYHIKSKLYNKGFSGEEIEEALIGE